MKNKNNNQKGKPWRLSSVRRIKIMPRLTCIDVSETSLIMSATRKGPVRLDVQWPPGGVNIVPHQLDDYRPGRYIL